MNPKTLQLFTQLYAGRQITMPEQLEFFSMIERTLESRSWGNDYPEHTTINNTEPPMDNLTITMLGQTFPHLTNAGRKEFKQTFLPRIQRFQFRFWNMDDFEAWHKSFAEKFGMQNVAFLKVEETPMYEGRERITVAKQGVDEEPSLICFHDIDMVWAGHEHKSDERGCWVEAVA